MFNCYFSLNRNSDHYDVLPYVAEIRTKYDIADDMVIRVEISRDYRYENGRNYLEIFLIIRDGFCVSVSKKEVIVYYNADVSQKEVCDLISMGSSFVIEDSIPKSIYMIKYEYEELILEPFKIRPCEIDIDMHYNEDFKKIHKRIESSLNKGKNGIILLHGNYGTGKTFYIRHLINTIDRRFVFFPINMVHCLSSPSLLPFIAKHPDIVLILEDCESLIMKREDEKNESSALSNLLNIGDGLLGDALQINVLCTFNSKLTEVDEALLRTGRLIARYEFNELEIDKAQDLAIHLGIGKVITAPMTVADIYDLHAKQEVPF